MHKQLVLNLNLAITYLDENDLPSLSNYLRSSFKVERGEDGKPLLYEFSTDTLETLHTIMSSITNNQFDQNNKTLLVELIRSLRNYVINPQVQNFLIEDGKILKKIKIIFNDCSETNRDLIKITLQFLINLVILNPKAASAIYKMFFVEIFSVLRSNFCILETSALLYNISLHQNLNLDFDMYSHIIDLYETNHHNEYLHFLLETFLSYSDLWYHYRNLDLRRRLIILGLIRHKQIAGEKLKLPMQALNVLSKSFVESGNIIFQTVSQTVENLEPYEVSQLLQVISSFCSYEEYLKVLQKNKDLLINSGVLLINLHKLGKESNNCFSSIQNLSELRQPATSIREHPAFGFKADLIRLIGNLCWKNKVMQDLAREAELIPIILDCCNMDARNPFIMQWVILAVRNLCENNIENQKIIAGLHQQGAVSSSVLEELGLTLHSDEANSIKVIPLDALKKQG